MRHFFSAGVLIAYLFVPIFAQKKQPSAQEKQPPFTSAQERLASYTQRQTLLSASLVKNVPFRNIGPTVMSGRVVDLDVNVQDPTQFYVAYASGGLWHTRTNGITFEPLFDTQETMTIGDIAVDWKANQNGNETIWVGTGENNSSRSSYSGTGVYKSIDRGTTWQRMGLEETHHIGRVIISPTNSSTVYVAALGHLYSPNADRGVYKTTDGGKTWKKTLYINENTGVIDLVIDPRNPNILYASAWRRERRAWNFIESGEETGIYKSTDGGETWTLISTKQSGFPTGAGAGRIGLSLHSSDKVNALYAVIDNQTPRPKEELDKNKKTEITKDTLRSLSKEDFAKLDKKLLGEFLSGNGFPKEITADSVLKLVAVGTIKPITLVEYLEDANNNLFDTPIAGCEVYRSDDGGTTWKKTHTGYLDNVYFTYGYYFGQIRVSPANPDRIYIWGVPVLTSGDGGKTFTSIGADNVHVDHHALWINPNRPDHIVLGNDGGVHISYDNGKNWFKANSPAVAQAYHVAVDMATPYNVYTGLQDNGVWRAPSTYSYSTEWLQEGKYRYDRLAGGDGMQTAIDTRDNATIYTGWQFGSYYRINEAKNEFVSIRPKHKLGERPLRFNWMTPVALSKYNQDILYIAANRLYRSFDKGKTLSPISSDLTRGGKAGDVPFGTISSFDESGLRFGLLYAGTDDGLLHRTMDGGTTWDNLSLNLPANVREFWITRVIASHSDTATLYVTLNGYRYDNFEPHIYRSKDYGKTFERIGTNLPLEPVNVIKEDPVNANILYVGTDHGVYVSLDKGKTFQAFMGNGTKDGQLPHVAVHDLVIHPRDKEIVIGTHGRSLYIGNVAHIQQMTPETLEKPLVAFTVKPLERASWGERTFDWSEAKEPKVLVPLSARTGGSAQVTIIGDSVTIGTLSVTLSAGLNYVDIPVSTDSTALTQLLTKRSASANKDSKDGKESTAKPTTAKAAKNGKFYLPIGKYTVEITLGTTKVSAPFELTQTKRRRGGDDSATEENSYPDTEEEDME